MSNTYDLKNVSTTTDTVVIEVLDRANLAEIDRENSIDPKNGKQLISATYALASGNPDEPMKVSAIIRVDPKANAGIGEAVTTIKVETPLVCENGSSEELFRETVVSTMTIRCPGLVPMPDSADFLALAHMTLSGLFDATDGSDIPTTAVVDQLRYGIPTINS